MTRAVSAAGITLVELLVAVTITTLLAASLVALLAPLWRMAVVEPDTADAYQRLRVATDALLADLRAATAVAPGADGTGVTLEIEGVTRAYSLDATTLRRSDDDGPAWPVVDGVAALAFEETGGRWIRVRMRLVRPPERSQPGVGSVDLQTAATPRSGSAP